MRNRRLAHQTLGARKHAVEAGADWEFQPGDRIIADGIPGVVDSVDDSNPFGIESYAVTLDNGLGGGEYTAAQLSRPGSNTAALINLQEPSDALSPVEATSQLTAAFYYPELGTILEDRPPNERIQRTAGLQHTAFGPSEFVFSPGTKVMVGGVPGFVVRALAAPPNEPFAEHSYVIGFWNGLGQQVLSQGQLVRTAGLHTYNHQHVAAYDPIAEETVQEPPSVCSFCGNPGPWTDEQDTGRGTRIRCATCGGTMRLNADPEAGTTGIQWQPEFPNSPENAASRAGDPRATVNDFRIVSELTFPDGPHVHYLRFGDWPEDERSHSPAGGYKEEGVSVYDTHRGHPVVPGDEIGYGEYGNDTHHELQGRINEYHRGNVPAHVVKGEMVGVGYDGEPLLRHIQHVTTLDPEQHRLHPVWKERVDKDDDGEGLGKMSRLNAPATQEAGYAIFTAPELKAHLEQQLQATAASLNGVADEDFVFHFIASWADVRKKATRIRKEGGVRILAATASHVVGEVQGDTAIYESAFNYVPGTRKVADWACGCKWGAYAWGRSPAYQRFEGRQCSHVLALQYEAQSRGMFGREVSPDRDRLEGQYQRSPVQVQYERPTDRYPEGRDLRRRTVPPGNMRRTFSSSIHPDSEYAVDGHDEATAYETAIDRVRGRHVAEGNRLWHDEGKDSDHHANAYSLAVAPENALQNYLDANGGRVPTPQEHVDYMRGAYGDNQHPLWDEVEDEVRRMKSAPHHEAKLAYQYEDVPPSYDWARIFTALGTPPSEVLHAMKALGVPHRAARAAIDWATKSTASAAVATEDGQTHVAVAVENGLVHTASGRQLPVDAVRLVRIATYSSHDVASEGDPAVDQFGGLVDSREHAAHMGFLGDDGTYLGNAYVHLRSHEDAPGGTIHSEVIPAEGQEHREHEIHHGVDDWLGENNLGAHTGWIHDDESQQMQQQSGYHTRHAAKKEQTATADPSGGQGEPGTDIPRIDKRDQSDAKKDPRHLRHHTNDGRMHAPNWGYGVPWGGAYLWCDQCRGSGCGHCGGTGQVQAPSDGSPGPSEASTTNSPMDSQGVDAGDMIGSDGMSATGALHEAAESGFSEGNRFAERLDSSPEDEPYIVPRFHEYARDYTAPTGHTYRLLHGVGMGGNSHVTAHQPLSNGKYRGVGYVSWFDGKPRHDGNNIDGGVIYKAHVSAPHRRRGLASAMLDFAREMKPEMDIRHSTALSEDGKEWAQAHASLQHTADYSVNDFGSGNPAQTYQQITPRAYSPNPGSTGWASSADPSGWVNPIVNSNFLHWESMLHHGFVMTAAGDTSKPPTVAGVALKAGDTGRVLMIQRSNKDKKDPAAGTWEFPGGHREDGDLTSLHAGIREWEEEVGQPFPEGGHVTHVHRNGPYVLHTVVVPEESAVDFTNGRATTNPDDPDGDDHEQAAWWDLEHARKNPALRQECKSSPWGDIKKAAVKTARLLTIDEARAAGAAEVARTGKSAEQLLREGPSLQHDLDLILQAALHDEPEPALPSTTGDNPVDDATENASGLNSVPDNASQLATPGLPVERSVPWGYPESAADHPNPAVAQPGSADLDMEAPTDQDQSALESVISSFQRSAGFQALMSDAAPQGGDGPTDADIAAAARAALTKTGMKDFSFAEQQELIAEGGGRARARNFGDLRITGTHYEHLGDGEPNDEALYLFL